MGYVLSPYKQAKAREIFNLFTFLNSISWTFIAASTVTLFALRCHASSTLVGIISSFAYISYFFLPVGKLVCRRFPIVKVFSAAWILRSVGMVPFIAAPFAAMAGRENLALVMLVAAVAIFHFFRGVGMVANNPVLNFLATGPDKSSYMTQTQVINNAVGMFSGFIAAIALGGVSSLWMYSLIAAAGVINGVCAGISIGKVPEPPPEESKSGSGFFSVFKKALADIPVKNFMMIFFLVAFVSGVARTFIVVYARDIFAQGDGMVSLYSVFGSFGSFLIGLCIKFLVERIGAKPIFIICTALGIFSLLMLVFLHFTQETAVIMFLALAFLLVNFAFIGAENVGQTYYLCLIPKEMMLDLGIMYFIIFGIAGAGGSFLSGIILDTLTGFGMTRILAFKILFIFLSIMLAAALFLQRGLISLGALPVRDALEVIFSFRDLRAISILDKLEKSEDTKKEHELLERLHENPSPLAISGLLERARSPRFATRTEAFDAMRSQQELNEDAVRALMNDIENHPYTTAHQSAHILGSHNCTSAIPLLRKSVHSDDYMLAGEAMIALARLKDEESRGEIEKIISDTRNPRLQIMGVETFGIYKSVHSLPVLFRMLKADNPPPYLRDEVCLAMANILDIYTFYYKLILKYLAAPEIAGALAADEAESALEYFKSAFGNVRIKDKSINAEYELLKKAAEIFPYCVQKLVSDPEHDAAPLSRLVLNFPTYMDCDTKALVFTEAVLQDDIRAFQRIQLLAVQWAARMLRLWTSHIKEKL
ncbi:MAG: MFS transporter [Spirochaetaceae bacterium]|nr:MFS transporter [Spirochaetaceae bacterium]